MDSSLAADGSLLYGVFHKIPQPDYSSMNVVSYAAMVTVLSPFQRSG